MEKRRQHVMNNYSRKSPLTLSEGLINWVFITPDEICSCSTPILLLFHCQNIVDNAMLQDKTYQSVLVYEDIAQSKDDMI